MVSMQFTGTAEDVNAHDVVGCDKLPQATTCSQDRACKPCHLPFLLLENLINCSRV